MHIHAGSTDAWLRKGRSGGRIVHLRGRRVRRWHWPKVDLADTVVVALFTLVAIAGLAPPILIARMLHTELGGDFGGAYLVLSLPKSLWLVVSAAILGKAIQAAAWTIVTKDWALHYAVSYLYVCNAVLGAGWLLFYHFA